MTINRIGSVAVAFGVAAALAACSNDITNLNENPNSPVSAPPGALFTQATQTSASRWLGTTYNMRGTEFVAQHLAEVQYPDEDRYSRLQGPQTTSTFDRAYTRELEDLRKVIAAGEAESNAAIYGPALVLRAIDFEYLTDSWGDIPYTQALQGDTTTGSLAPSYDTQQSIYTDLFATLRRASTDMASATGADLGSADPIYGGNLEQWVKLSNSLRARMAMRIVNKDPNTAETELAAALSDPGKLIEDNADNAMVAWPGDGVYDNPWADNFLTRDDHRMSQTLMNILVANSDPRTQVFAQAVKDSTLYPGGYGGMPNGLNSSDAGTYANTASKVGKIFYDFTTPSYFMTAAEVLFIKAEAAERGMAGLSASQAQGFYNAAITASMEQWGITDPAVISAYLAQPNVAYKGGIDGQKQIAVQKWIALFGDGGNAWAEWRRTCQPATIKHGPDAIVDFVPRRFEYSQTEYSVNGDNVSAALSQMGGGDTFDTRMWWDTNPTAAPTFETTQTCAGS
ncbi:MAG TPA: SusD/RagB family nutrient-binding outer membrane lipoprotein [Gemmatimonadaceae bacterium]